MTEPTERIDSDESAPEIDITLQSLVSIANSSDPDDASEYFAITLTVNGLIISGDLIGYDRYWRELSEVPLLAGFTRMVLDAKDSKSPAQAPLPQFIHMRNTKIWITPGIPVPSEGTHWRGRLASVDGFSFGSLGASPQ